MEKKALPEDLKGKFIELAHKLGVSQITLNKIEAELSGELPTAAIPVKLAPIHTSEPMPVSQTSSKETLPIPQISSTPTLTPVNTNPIAPIYGTNKPVATETPVYETPTPEAKPIAKAEIEVEMFGPSKEGDDNLEKMSPEEMKKKLREMMMGKQGQVEQIDLNKKRMTPIEEIISQYVKQTM